MVSVRYIYHSCFMVETESLLLVFDYWKDDASGTLHRRLSEKHKPVYVFASHFHEDHYQPEILTWKNGLGEPVSLLLSYDIVKRRGVDKSLLKAVLRPGVAFQDEYLKVMPFRSTDIGVAVAVWLPDGTVVFHAGDLNNWYFPDDPSHLKVSVKEMEGLFLSVVREVRKKCGRVDYLMFPVDSRLGAEMCRGLSQWLKQVPTGHVYPMHCWEAESEVAEALVPLQDLYPGLEMHKREDLAINLKEMDRD